MDNDTAKIGAQELDHETPKECALDPSEEGNGCGSPDNSSPIEHTDKEINRKERDIEAGEGEEHTPEAIKVPRAQRRGLFGRFTIVAEVTEPKHYPRGTKWFITFVVALAAVAAPMGSAIFFRKAHPLVHVEAFD